MAIGIEPPQGRLPFTCWEQLSGRETLSMVESGPLQRPACAVTRVVAQFPGDAGRPVWLAKAGLSEISCRLDMLFEGPWQHVRLGFPGLSVRRKLVEGTALRLQLHGVSQQRSARTLNDICGALHIHTRPLQVWLLRLPQSSVHLCLVFV